MKLYQGLLASDGTHLRTPEKYRPGYARFEASCPAGTEWEVTIKRKSKRQGSQTLRYLRGVVIPDIAEACGYSDPEDYNDVYEGLMWKLFRLADGKFGEPRRMSFAKAVCPQELATDMVSKIIEHAETTIVGCRIRRPNEVDMDNVPMTWAPADESEAA
jgi:hypothetical protein